MTTYYFTMLLWTLFLVLPRGEKCAQQGYCHLQPYSPQNKLKLFCIEKNTFFFYKENYGTYLNYKL